MKRKISLRFRLSGLMAAISVCALLLYVTLGRNSAKTTQSVKAMALSSIATSVTNKIDRIMLERFSDVQAFALSEAARSGARQRITEFMNDMISAYAPAYDLMIVTNEQGRVIAVNSQDKRGKSVNTEWLIGKDYSSSAWFRAAIRDEIRLGESYVENPHHDPDVARVYGGEGRVMTFTAPIRDRISRKVIGVWTNHMNWADVVTAAMKDEIALLTSETIPHLYPYILADDGTYLFHPFDHSVELKQKWPVQLPRSIKSPLVSSVDLKVSHYQGPGIEAVTEFRGQGSFKGMGWRLALREPMRDHQSTFNTWIYVIAAAVQIFGWLVGYRMVRRIAIVLEGVINELSAESQNVQSAAGQIAEASSVLSRTTNEQAAALEETSASIEEMNAMIQKSADNSKESSESTEKSQEVATQGKRSVDQMIQAIQEINQSNGHIMSQINESNQQISDIVKVIMEIGSKTKVINDIVFQTKLLSFNASVEAARAGEHGKGFAVVAEEVGNLAQMSGTAAREIGQMLESSIAKVQSIVKDTQQKVDVLVTDGKSKVEAGTQVAVQCKQVLEAIVTSAEEVNVRVREITVAASEQTQGMQEISRAMSSLDQTTQSNSSTSKQAADAATALSRQAEHLLSLVGTLATEVRGGKGKGLISVPPQARDQARAIETAEVQVPPAPAPVTAAPAAQTKVVPIRQPKPAAADPASALTNEPVFVASGGPAMKLIAGERIPSEDDPRFKDL